MTQLSERVTDFDRTTALVPSAEKPGEFGVELDDGWSSLVGIHGGYMSALTVVAAEATAGTDRTARTITTSFLRTGQPGPATVVVRTIRSGRSITTATADVVQDDKILVTSRLTLVTDRQGVEWNTAAPIDVLPLDRVRARQQRGWTLRPGRRTYSTRGRCRSRTAPRPRSAGTSGRWSHA